MSWKNIFIIKTEPPMKQADFWKKLKYKNIECTLCPHNCIIQPDKTGICGVRKNINGTLYAMSYGKVSAINIDPVEKKPLFHFYPGEQIVSFGTIGCNLKCPYCQNWSISQNPDYKTETISPETAVNTAKRNNLKLIAYTYSEPVIWYEFIYDTAELAHKNNIKNVLVTNGFINKEPLKKLIPFIDAANIDIKAFNNDFYTKLVKGRLKPVLKNIEYLADKIHIELTMLIIPGQNDNLDEVKKFTDWLYHINPDIPVHFSRYYPQYKFNTPPTPLETLSRIYETAKEKLNFVYIGNASIKNSENSYCPHCSNLLIERNFYTIKIKGLNKNKCNKCNKELNFTL